MSVVLIWLKICRTFKSASKNWKGRAHVHTVLGTELMDIHLNRLPFDFQPDLVYLTMTKITLSSEEHTKLLTGLSELFIMLPFLYLLNFFQHCLWRLEGHTDSYCDEDAGNQVPD